MNVKVKKTFYEQYLVKINFQREDSLWEWGKEVNILVPIKHGVNEKNNHKRAENKVREKYPNCEIVSVSYC